MTDRGKRERFVIPSRWRPARLRGDGVCIRYLGQTRKERDALQFALEAFCLVAVVDSEGELKYVSAGVRKILGYDASELLGRRVEDYLVPEDIPKALIAFRRLLAGADDESRLLFRLLHADGEPRVVESLWRRIERRGATMVLSVSRALPAGASGELLYVTEERFRTMVERLPLVTYIDELLEDGEQRVVYVSPQIRELLGIARREWLCLADWKWSNRLHPDDLAALEKTREAYRRREPIELEYRLRHRDGRYLWLRNTAVPIPEKDGSVRFYQGYVIDITEHRALLERVHETSSALEALIENAPLGIVVLSEEGRILVGNPQALRFLSLEGEAWDRLGIDRLPRPIAEIVDRCLAGDEFRGLEVVLEAGSSPLTLLVSTAVWSSLEGRRVLLMLDDFTERKALDEYYRQLQRLESVGRLAGGVAHDLRNLLTVVNGYADMLAGHEQPLVAQRGAAIRQAAESASRLTAQLLAFARRQPVNSEIVSLNEILASYREMLQRLAGERITLVTRFAPNLSPVIGNRTQFEQVIVNLVTNACDAMPDGGTIVIETAPVEISPDDEIYDLSPGSYSLLIVSDTGQGMSQEVLARIFEPFYTTKRDAGRGTGLGLTMAYGVVKQYGGSIVVDSEPGVGSSFSVYLPIAAQGDAIPQGVTPCQSESAQSDEAVGDRAWLVGLQILLVEDERVVREFIADLLREYGADVYLAANGPEAIEAAVERPPSLLVTDLRMPGMDGRQLAGRLRAMYPSLPILFVSGYDELAVIDEASSRASPAGTPAWRDFERASFLSKPFTLEEFERAAYSLLR